MLDAVLLAEAKDHYQASLDGFTQIGSSLAESVHEQLTTLQTTIEAAQAAGERLERRLDDVVLILAREHTHVQVEPALDCHRLDLRRRKLLNMLLRKRTPRLAHGRNQRRRQLPQPLHGDAKVALSAALHDLAGKRAGQPVWRMWGLEPAGPSSSSRRGLRSTTFMAAPGYRRTVRRDREQ